MIKDVHDSAGGINEGVIEEMKIWKNSFSSCVFAHEKGALMTKLIIWLGIFNFRSRSSFMVGTSA